MYTVQNPMTKGFLLDHSKYAFCGFYRRKHWTKSIVSYVSFLFAREKDPLRDEWAYMVIHYILKGCSLKRISIITKKKMLEKMKMT